MSDSLPVAVHTYAAKHCDRPVFFYFIRLEGSVFIWVGERNFEFTDFHVALPSRSRDDPLPATCLYGDLDSLGNDLSSKLSSKFNEPLYVSINVNECDDEMRLFIHKHLLHQLKNRHTWGTEQETRGDETQKKETTSPDGDMLRALDNPTVACVVCGPGSSLLESVHMPGSG
eukprot:GDKI01035255.1.p1 GENE.GDKI01035255.1~~GDKI01035255.1.p1  ORF type:complete len:195 (-),score=41.16 GDKI01035255.1:35-550(-)